MSIELRNAHVPFKIFHHRLDLNCTRYAAVLRNDGRPGKQVQQRFSIYALSPLQGKSIIGHLHWVAVDRFVKHAVTEYD